MKIVLGISGKIRSGKTSFANVLSDALGFQLVSFGDFVRQIASTRKISLTRENLQDLGQKLVDENLKQFCDDVIYSNGWKKDSGLVVDGIRHVEVLQTLKNLVTPLPFFLIYINTENSERASRIGSLYLKNIDNHETEKDAQYALPTLADLIIDGSLSLDEMLKVFLDWRAVKIADNLA